MSPAMIGLGVMLAAVPFAHHHRPRPIRIGAIAGRAVPHSSFDRRPHRSASVTLIAVALLTTAFIAGPVAAAAAASILLLRPRIAAEHRRRRALAEIASTYPDFVDLFVLTIRSGCTPVQAVRVLSDPVTLPTTSRIQSALAEIDRRVSDGTRFAEAIGELPAHLGVIARPLADGLAFADRHGTPLAPMLDRLADEAHAQRRRNSEASARQLPIRLSFPLVGCTLPSFVLLTIVPLLAGTLSSLRSLRP